MNCLPVACIIVWYHFLDALLLKVTGFLGGTSWAVLVARICQLYPNAIPSMLVSRFFRVYTLWHWPNPVMLCSIEEDELGFLPWDPHRNPEDWTHKMPVITPALAAYPCMNSSSHVSACALEVLMSQFQLDSKVCEVSCSKFNLLYLFFISPVCGCPFWVIDLLFYSKIQDIETNDAQWDALF